MRTGEAQCYCKRGANSVSNCMFLNRTHRDPSVFEFKQWLPQMAKQDGIQFDETTAEVKVLLTVKSEGSLGGRLPNLVAARELVKNCPTQ